MHAWCYVKHFNLAEPEFPRLSPSDWTRQSHTYPAEFWFYAIMSSIVLDLFWVKNAREYWVWIPDAVQIRPCLRNFLLVDEANRFLSSDLKLFAFAEHCLLSSSGRYNFYQCNRGEYSTSCLYLWSLYRESFIIVSAAVAWANLLEGIKLDPAIRSFIIMRLKHDVVINASIPY
jgi:hypothetical protein